MFNGEIIIYQSTDQALQFEVRIENNTVWLTQAQMAELFLTTRNNITLHNGNVFKEKELEKDSVCKESLLTAQEGKKWFAFSLININPEDIMNRLDAKGY